MVSKCSNGFQNVFPDESGLQALFTCLLLAAGRLLLLDGGLLLAAGRPLFSRWLQACYRPVAGCLPLPFIACGLLYAAFWWLLPAGCWLLAAAGCCLLLLGVICCLLFALIYRYGICLLYY